jgi:hypothetical protein
MTELTRLAVWEVVDDLVARVYQASGQVADVPTRELLREAVLALGPMLPPPVLLGRLEVVAALLVAASKTGALSVELADTLGQAITRGAQALRRLATGDHPAAAC